MKVSDRNRRICIIMQLGGTGLEGLQKKKVYKETTKLK